MIFSQVIPIHRDTSANYFHHSFGYEKIMELRLENQALTINFNLHFKTTSYQKLFLILMQKECL